MKTMVAVPCLDMMHTDFVTSLTGLRHDGNIKIVYCASSLVYDSRNSLARRAILEGFDRVLWLDSDMKFGPDLFLRLSADLDEGRDMVSGLYVSRKPPIKPVIYSSIGYDHIEGSLEVKPYAKQYYDYPRDAIFEVEACGFGVVMMKTSLLEEVEKKFGLPFAPIMGFGEDLSFCLRVKELGVKMYCDSAIKAGHVGMIAFVEEMYLAGREKECLQK